jgi:drug/metabolite transporter (DMT)-like permease
MSVNAPSASRLSTSSAGLGLAAVLVTVLIWGTQFPIAKSALAVMDGFTLSLFRYAIASLVLLLILYFREGPAALSIAQRVPITALAGLGMACSAILVFVGLELTRPEIAVVIIQLQPAMTALVEWRLHDKRPSRFTLVCLALAFFGVVFAVTGGGVGLPALLRTNPIELFGDLLVWLGSLGWVAYTVLTGRITGWSPLRLSSLSCAVGALFIAAIWPLAWLAGLVRWPDWSHLLLVSGGLAHVALLGVVVAMFLWNVGVRHIGSLNAMLLLHLMPIITFGFRALQGAQIGLSELLGAGLVLAALIANNAHVRRRAADLSSAGVVADERDTPAQ